MILNIEANVDLIDVIVETPIFLPNWKTGFILVNTKAVKKD